MAEMIQPIHRQSFHFDTAEDTARTGTRVVESTACIYM